MSRYRLNLSLTLMISVLLFLHRGMFFFSVNILFGDGRLHLIIIWDVIIVCASESLSLWFCGFSKKKKQHLSSPSKGNFFLRPGPNVWWFFVSFLFSLIPVCWDAGSAVVLGSCCLTQIHLSTCVSSFPSSHAGVYFLGLVLALRLVCVLHSPSLHHCLGTGVFTWLWFWWRFSPFSHLLRVVKHTRDSSEQIRSFNFRVQLCFPTQPSFSLLYKSCTLHA